MISKKSYSGSCVVEHLVHDNGWYLGVEKTGSLDINVVYLWCIVVYWFMSHKIGGLCVHLFCRHDITIFWDDVQPLAFCFSLLPSLIGGIGRIALRFNHRALATPCGCTKEWHVAGLLARPPCGYASKPTIQKRVGQNSNQGYGVLTHNHRSKYPGVKSTGAILAFERDKRGMAAKGYSHGVPVTIWLQWLHEHRRSLKAASSWKCFRMLHDEYKHQLNH